MYVTAQEYAQGCENILGRPVTEYEVVHYLDELNEEVLRMMAMLELGVTTKTEH